MQKKASEKPSKKFEKLTRKFRIALQPIALIIPTLKSLNVNNMTAQIEFIGFEKTDGITSEMINWCYQNNHLDPKKFGPQAMEILIATQCLLITLEQHERGDPDDAPIIRYGEKNLLYYRDIKSITNKSQFIIAGLQKFAHENTEP